MRYGKGRKEKCFYFGKPILLESWILNGYELQKVDLKKRTIVLHRNTNEYVPVKIPEQLLSDKISKDAKFEIENFCEHIKEKYGL